MNQGEIRRCKIHRRINVLRNRYDRRILGSMTVLITGLTICMGILLQMAGVIFTVICIRFRDRKAHKQQE